MKSITAVGHAPDVSTESIELEQDSLAVSVGPLTLRNPIMPASGCFGPELGALIATEKLGAVVTKTFFEAVRSGNPAHRLAETYSGMLNSVGIPSPGRAEFRSSVLPAYRALGAPVIVSIGGLTVEEYWAAAGALADEDFAAIEINVSCPNLEHGGLEIGASSSAIERVTAGVVERAEGRPVITKLTPNVGSIVEIALAAEAGGAAAVTVANTYVGLAIDAKRRAAILGNTVGGFSGPAVKPLILRLVWETSKVVSVPVIGCGGVRSAADAAEYLIAGASAVQVGTATFARPAAMLDIISELPRTLSELGVERARDLVGTLVA